MFESVGSALVEVGHDEDSGPTEDGFGTDDLEVLCLSVGEEIDGHAGDGQMEAVGIALPIDQIVLMRFVRQGEEILGNKSVAFIEGLTSLWTSTEQYEEIGEI